MNWFKQLKEWLLTTFCEHEWEYREYNAGYYDQERWFECTKCKLQKEIK